MTILPLLILAAGLNSAIPASLPVSHAQRAEIVLDRAVAAAEPVLQQRAIERALTDARRDFGHALADQIADTRIRSRTDLAVVREHARASLDRQIAAARPALLRRATNLALADARRDFGHALAREITAAHMAFALAHRPAHTIADGAPTQALR